MPGQRSKKSLHSRGKISDSVYSNPPMKTIILVKRLCLRHILVRLTCLLSTFPPHKQLYTTARQPPVATNPFHLPLWHPALRGVSVLELGVIPYFNGRGTTAWEMLGDRIPRKTLLLLQLRDLCVVYWRVSRPPRG